MVNEITELNDNIIRIDFMHCNKLISDVDTRQVKFANSQMNTICATKQITIPAMTLSIVTAKFQGETHQEKTYIATINCPGTPTITGVLAVVSINENNNCKIMVENCSLYKVMIESNDLMGLMEIKEDELIPLTDDTATEICASIRENIPKSNLSRDEIVRRCNLQVPDEFREKYIDILFKHQEAISLDKYDLGFAKKYKHQIHLKNDEPFYQKQFKIPKAHHQFIKQTLEEWLKLRVVQISDLLYNSPIFCVPKKQGQGLRIVKDFRELNQNFHIDKYSMKEIIKCIGDIG
jgi:hypothetical protein